MTAAGFPIHLLIPPLSERTRTSADHAVSLVAAVIEGSLARNPPSVVLAPAGLATFEDEHQALACAERVRAVARRAHTAIFFGLDVGPPAQHAGRLFACIGGSPVLWPERSQARFPLDPARRIVQLGGARFLPLFAAEALDPAAPRRVEKLGGVDVIAVLSHGGATRRWVDALARLEALAPLVVATHSGGAGRGYVSPTLEVSFRQVGVDGPITQAA